MYNAIGQEAIAERISPPAFLNRGKAYHAKGDLDRAFADYDQAVRIDLIPTPSRPCQRVFFKRVYDRAIAELYRGRSAGSEIRLSPSITAAAHMQPWAISIAPSLTTIRQSGSIPKPPMLQRPW